MKEDLMRVINARARLRGGKIAYEVNGVNNNLNMEILAVVLAIPHNRFEIFVGFINGEKVTTHRATTLMDAVVLAILLHDQLMKW